MSSLEMPRRLPFGPWDNVFRIAPTEIAPRSVITTGVFLG
jgi:hypothetical protein